MSQTVINFDKADTGSQAVWLTGQVVNQDQNNSFFNVVVDDQVYTAQRAFSCLMEPLVGDMVCLMSTGEETLYVTAILERHTSPSGGRAEASLHFDGHLSLKAEAGLSLETEKKLRISAKQLEGTVSEVSWISKMVQITSKELFVVTGLARLTCKMRELFAGYYHLSADNSFRNIAKTDNVRVGVYNLRADSLASIKAPCTLIKAKKLAKVDSAQIHIG